MLMLHLIFYFSLVIFISRKKGGRCIPVPVFLVFQSVKVGKLLEETFVRGMVLFQVEAKSDEKPRFTDVNEDFLEDFNEKPGHSHGS